MGKLKSILKDKDVSRFLRACLLFFVCAYILFRILDYKDFFIEKIQCGAEETMIKDNREFFISGNYNFGNAIVRSTDIAFEGGYSIRLEPKAQYGFKIELEAPKAEQEYTASVWYYEEHQYADSAGSFFLVGTVGNNNFWQGTEGKEADLSTKKGWKKLELKIVIPNKLYSEPMTFYCWNNKKNVVYFDDLVIERKNYRQYF